MTELKVNGDRAIIGMHMLLEKYGSTNVSVVASLHGRKWLG